MDNSIWRTIRLRVDHALLEDGLLEDGHGVDHRAEEYRCGCNRKEGQPQPDGHRQNQKALQVSAL